MSNDQRRATRPATGPTQDSDNDTGTCPSRVSHSAHRARCNVHRHRSHTPSQPTVRVFSHSLPRSRYLYTFFKLSFATIGLTPSVPPLLCAACSPLAGNLAIISRHSIVVRTSKAGYLFLAVGRLGAHKRRATGTPSARPS